MEFPTKYNQRVGWEDQSKQIRFELEKMKTTDNTLLYACFIHCRGLVWSAPMDVWTLACSLVGDQETIRNMWDNMLTKILCEERE